VSAESVPTKFRSRSMIIVYYDSDIQKTFEGIVRNIGTARNNIRKARMANRMETISTGTTISLSTARTSPNDTFGVIDNALEKAQSLCERGAHQFLREGDCESEISGAKDSFEEAKRLSEQELVTLKAAKEVQQQQEKEEAKRLSLVSGYNGEPNSGILEADDDESEDVEEMVLTKPRFSVRSTRSMART